VAPLHRLSRAGAFVVPTPDPSASLSPWQVYTVQLAAFRVEQFQLLIFVCVIAAALALFALGVAAMGVWRRG
jgi:hypothetical protein